MNKVPHIIGSAKVILYAIVGDIIATGSTTHVVGNQLIEWFHGVAICQYEGDSGYYLFYCNKMWETITDTWHETIEDAKDQAQHEYKRIYWQSMA
ncbi:hypothetical protein [Mucilaginibacter lappiensis]|uniref:hypothetical protein n=1 Tax=Mucilaginibacter lappiensis TaxID=354630 RepID=UPI003D231FEC